MTIAAQARRVIAKPNGSDGRTCDLQVRSIQVGRLASKSAHDFPWRNRGVTTQDVAHLEDVEIAGRTARPEIDF